MGINEQEVPLLSEESSSSSTSTRLKTRSTDSDDDLDDQTNSLFSDLNLGVQSINHLSLISNLIHLQIHVHTHHSLLFSFIASSNHVYFQQSNDDAPTQGELGHWDTCYAVRIQKCWPFTWYNWRSIDGPNMYSLYAYASPLSS